MVVRVWNVVRGRCCMWLKELVQDVDEEDLSSDGLVPLVNRG